MHDELKSFVFRELVHVLDETSFSGDDDLLEAGLDSMGIMRLVLFIEERFGVTLPDEEIEPDNIQTLNRISSWIERHR
ncbi:MAG: phosphopantetheine-binding protein [Zetaproteobacteria bacterium CG12_big_fil_rev_8_21_14_0_65_55_1124]|nr:MAG: phosphopantetheine-binding protein [Zetaproteobacteria bacterium CG1_02_55_237]PIS20364.1 MAG: phosphopantetheine-binding protein [Zetaproteobacteria bacterium CG08_land_8_20_14_0_20_55_17]PIW42411.1 MAG: phosphopantetheine-binding protein [Zetaproteobacteria bacterium CG12_big_fil_rev_8_21_14_0_65_55_1124]PIY52366.1 MAG: phosphopantetheine-binding protein [Zetaproteobacteria bacterium CG_4_10_14_0_8_um_filter_55_43]PIZ37145.1 MAG: phosphopantetheine-binding protein [Zetaproteobacteria 